LGTGKDYEGRSDNFSEKKRGSKITAVSGITLPHLRKDEGKSLHLRGLQRHREGGQERVFIGRWQKKITNLFSGTFTKSGEGTNQK